MSPRHSIGDYRAASQERMLRSPIPTRRNPSSSSVTSPSASSNNPHLIVPPGQSQSSQSAHGVPLGGPISDSINSHSQPTTPQNSQQRYMSLSLVSNGKADRV